MYAKVYSCCLSLNTKKVNNELLLNVYLRSIIVKIENCIK